MRRRRLAAVGALLALAGGTAAVVFDPAARVQGWVRGEPFYRGRSATAWRRDLRQVNAAESAGAFTALVEGKAEAVPVCAWVLRTAPEAEARWRAADALGQIGADARAAGPELVAALSDPDHLVRGVAVRAAGALAPDLAGAVPQLVRLFPDVNAIRAVSRFGAAGRPAVGPLTELLKSEDPVLRRQAARALGKLGPISLPAVGELVRLLRSDPDALVREHAAEALGDIGPEAAAGVPALVGALKDPVPRVRRDAVRSLGQMGVVAKGVLHEVLAAGNDPDPDVKGAAARSARLIDPTLPAKN
jgi:HEAT repeat protein